MLPVTIFRRSLSHSSYPESTTQMDQSHDLVISPASDPLYYVSQSTTSRTPQKQPRSLENTYEEYGQPPTSKKSRFRRFKLLFGKGGKLQPFRLLREDQRNLRQRWVSDWCLFNQLILASAVYVFFTNILPGITFASDLNVLTGQAWGTIEVVFSTGLCGLIFAL